MRLQQIVIEYPNGHLDAADHIDHLRGMHVAALGGRPIHIYLPRSASRYTYNEANLIVNPFEGKVSYMKADFDGNLEEFKMNRLLGLI